MVETPNGQKAPEDLNDIEFRVETTLMLRHVAEKLELVNERIGGLPCKSNNPAIDPLQRMATLEAEVESVKSRASRNSGMISAGVTMLVNAAMWVVKGKMGGG